MNKKQAGTDRPYTIEEFAEKLIAIAEKKDYCKDMGLDYFIPDRFHSDGEITRWDGFDVTFKLTFGGSEGIYVDFYLDCGQGKVVDFATAKTLKESKEAFIEMSKFAAQFVLDAFDYLHLHHDEFDWSGWNVGVSAESGIFWYVTCYDYDRVQWYVGDLKKKHPKEKIYVKDMRTRKVEEF